MLNPLVSIITPCLNGERYMRKLFDSIIAQTYRPIEYFFVNDGSTDKTDQIAKAYAPRFEKEGIEFHYITQKNAGQCAALNAAFARVTGKYLSWIDCDDWYAPAFVEKHVRFMENNPEVGDAVNDVAVVNARGGTLRINKYPFADNMAFFNHFIDDARFCWPLTHMVRFSDFLRFYPDRKIHDNGYEQTPQIIMPIAYHFKVARLPEVLGYYTERGDSDSHRQRPTAVRTERAKRYLQSRADAVRRTFADNPAAAEPYLRRLANKMAQLNGQRPASRPAAAPASQPVSQPAKQPDSQPAAKQPDSQPAKQPDSQPVKQPDSQPAKQSDSKPGRQPARQPGRQPIKQPVRQPARQPGRRPMQSASANRTGVNRRVIRRPR